MPQRDGPIEAAGDPMQIAPDGILPTHGAAILPSLNPYPTPFSLRAAPLALLANLAVAGQSLAEEAAAAAPPADLPMFALSPSEIILVSTPVIGYTLFNIARQANPKLELSDGLLFIVAAFILGNIVSIVLFKTSYY